MKQGLLAILGVAALAACAGSQKPVPPAPDVPIAGDLTARELAPGDCGLFLWTQADPRRFVYFARAGASTADTMFGETEQTVALVRQGGTLFGQFMTEMDYVSTEDERIQVRISPGEVIEGGQKIADGRVSLQADGGWETIVPVRGLRACQPEPQ